MLANILLSNGLQLCVALIIVKLVHVVIRWCLAYKNLAKLINKIPGPQMIPFVGNAHIFKRKDGFSYQIYQLSRTYSEKPIFRIWLGTRATVIFHKADNLDVLFSSSKNTQKSYSYDFLQPWFGTGLLNSYGDKWQSRRRLITPSFHYEILGDFLNVMNEQVKIFVDKLSKQCDDKNESDGTCELDIFKPICLCTLDIICETAMGRHVGAQEGAGSDYVNAVSRMSEIVFERFMSPQYWNDWLFAFTWRAREQRNCLDILHSFTKRVIAEREQEARRVPSRSSSVSKDGSTASTEEDNIFASSTKKRRVAFLDMLLTARDENSEFTLDDIREEVDTFMFEGHDTTAVAAGWACYLIGSHPDVQRRLHAEIDSVFGSDSEWRDLTSDDLRELKYLDCVIKETLRLFPSVPFFGRELSHDEQCGEYTLPAGTTVTILTYMIHRDERYFPEPEKFDPDRFSLENDHNQTRHPYTYIPFSAGRRNCIGQRFAQMEEKVLLANLLRRFEIHTLSTLQQIRPIMELTLRPQNGIKVKLIPRRSHP